MDPNYCSKQDKNKQSLKKEKGWKKERLIRFMTEGERGREMDRTQKDQKYGTEVEKRRNRTRHM
jgi:hypothetical protein